MSFREVNKELRLPSKRDLQTSEICYRRLFETACVGIIILDAETRRITDVNLYMTGLLGYTREELLNRELREIGLLTDQVVNLAVFEELQKQSYIRFECLSIQTKAGDSREIEFIGNLYTDNDRQVIQCNISDITERKSAEKALKQAENNFRNLIESSPGIVYLYEPHPPFSIIYVSPNIKTYGYTPAEWYATPGMWSKIVYKEDRERVFAAFKSASKLGHETELEYRIVAKDGSIHWWQDKGCFNSDEDGNKLGWQGVILDITTTKELEQKLSQSQKLESVGLLAGGIAHDFNNMLTAINGYSDLTLRQLKEDDVLRVNIEEIKKAGKRSAALTHQLLAFSRQQVLQPVVIDLNEVVNDTIKMLKRLIGEDIQLSTSLNPRGSQVTVDPGQFSQIIMNLVLNSRDAMPQGGKLTIETTDIFLDENYTKQHIDLLPGVYVMMAVSDTGSGMDEETKKHIFEPFFTTKAVGEGTGLGLSTVYGIIKQSGGNIEVSSEVGVGTTFKIYLPHVLNQEDAADILKSAAEMPSGTETILLVEDEKLVRNLSREILQECGYSVIEAENGEEALSICDRDYHIDLLMTDVVMPKMGGRELAEKLKIKFPDMRILFTSGYTDDAVMRHGVIETSTNFIQKPFTPVSLAKKIRGVLNMSSKS